jgi:uncharacterized membrane protein
MMIMLLDHTRDFVHAGALSADPTDPVTTTVPLFFTRWITHYCAPTFVFLSGVSIYLQKLNGKSNAELSRFLLTRGLWLIFLELTVVRFGVVFNLDYGTFFGMFQVIWVIGASMIFMAALVWLPVRVVGIGALLMILLHNLLDPYQLPPQIAFGAGDPSFSQTWAQMLWIFLHQMGLISMPYGSVAFEIYPLIPWVGVMAAGWAFGSIYTWGAEPRRRMLLVIGITAALLFIILRFANVYGDPAPWGQQATTARTFLSFLNTTKYPPSLLFLLMTLGPSIAVLSLTDGIDGRAIWQRVAIIFGRVPMLYYILQWFTAHGLGLIFSLIAGKQIGYFFVDPGSSGRVAPADYGFSLGIVYLAWITSLAILFPICWWYGNFKKRHKHWILSYL